MIAITRVDGEYSIGDTVTRQRGYYTAEGIFLRGDKIMSEDEAGFRIFLQQTPLSEKAARKAWDARKTTC